MTLLLNDEQRQLADSAQAFLAERSPVASQRVLRDRDDTLGFEPALWQEVAEMGWTAAVFPETYGGLDFGWQGLGAVFESIGSTLAALPLLSSVVLGGSAVLATGSAAQKQRWMPGIVDGSRRFALALEEGGRHDPRHMRTRARRAGEGWVLEGEKGFVLDGVGADQFVVVAWVDAGKAPDLFVVDAGTAGLEVVRTRMVDSRNTAHLRLRGVQVAADALLDAPGEVAAPLDGVLDRARVCLAAEALGLLREVFDRTLDYLKERVQFGVKIGSFQALQHRAARLYCEVELLESCVRGGFEAIDAGTPDLPLLASLAKARASDLCVRMCDEAIQLHGGIGVTDEFDLGLFVKRARVIQHTFGDGAFHRERYARLRSF